jgi:hypothetical protein
MSPLIAERTQSPLRILFPHPFGRARWSSAEQHAFVRASSLTDDFGVEDGAAEAPRAIGLALNRICQPDMFGGPEHSIRLRDALLATIPREPKQAGPADSRTTTAIRLAVQLEVTDKLEPEEKALLKVWLASSASP